MAGQQRIDAMSGMVTMSGNSWLCFTNEDILRIKSDLEASTSGPKLLLEKLKHVDSMNLTVKHLEESQIGFTVRKLKKNSDAKVAELAGKIVEKWKKMIADEHARSKRKDSKDKGRPAGNHGGGRGPKQLSITQSLLQGKRSN